MKNKIYDKKFYENRDRETTPSAMEILKIVTDAFQVKTAVDFGCGVGTWLKCFKNLVDQNTSVLGLDGDYVPRDYMIISDAEFMPTNLNEEVKLNSRYDLAISLEVAEHLKPERSATFIKDICDAADVVLFSAATKYQGGDGHINEQRLSYWVELFKQQGYGMIDVVRPQIWNNTNIPVWYRENIVVFYNLKSETISKAATEAMIKYDEKLVDVIHPDLFEKRSKIVLNPAFRLLHKIKTAVMAPKNK